MRHYLLATALIFSTLFPSKTVSPASGSKPVAKSSTPNISAAQLLKAVVDHEVAADKDDHSLWMYTDQLKKGGTLVTERIVETKDGTITRKVAVNGQPLSASQRQEETARIEKLAANPDEPQKLQREQADDGDKAEQMLSILPQALIPTYGQHRGNLVALNFKPNPDYHPTSHEAEVFLAMAGTIWVNPKEQRLAEIDGHLIREVKFGDGILGHLNSGGRFRVVQSEEQPGHWEIVRLDVNMIGKALFFKSISVQQDETRSKYQRMPDGLTLRQGARKLDH